MVSGKSREAHDRLDAGFIRSVRAAHSVWSSLEIALAAATSNETTGLGIPFYIPHDFGRLSKAHDAPTLRALSILKFMTEKQWNVESRVERVKEIAARVCTHVRGESKREVMHAMALATAALINANFEGIGRQRALEQHINNVRHHQERGGH